MYNALSGRELAVIIGQQVTAALQEHGDFSAAIGYDNPKFTVLVRLEAMEVEPKVVTVTGKVKTESAPPGTRIAAKESTVAIEGGPFNQPDKARIQAGLIVPTQTQNEVTGEIADFKPDDLPF